MWQLLKVTLDLKRDLFALFVQQYNNISTDTERCVGLANHHPIIVGAFTASTHKHHH